MTPRVLQPVVRPFYSYYGSKWRIALRYPKPQYRTIVEPFAGSAGYALRYAGHDVRLYDVDPHIVGIWQYLLRVRPAELLALPDVPEGASVANLPVPQEAQWLIGFWVARGRTHTAVQPSPWMRGGDWVKSFWGPSVRAKLARQVDRIRHWTVELRDYRDVPDPGPATWFVDPPYQGSPGRRYRFDKVDYAALANWVRTRPGQCIVCEGPGATWLPFQPLDNGAAYLTSAPTRKRAAEFWWSNTP